MKEKIKSWLRGYKDNILYPQMNGKLFVAILVLGYVIHSFRITQMLNGADDVSLLMKGYGGGTTFGRWALDFFGFRVNYKWIIGSFNLSGFDGIITLIFLSLSICIILELFHLQNSKLGLLFAVVFIAYPVCSTTFLYMFTAAYYGFSCFLAVLAAWCLKTEKVLYGCIAVLCMAFSVGLYQAYFPVTVTLCLFMVLDYFLDGNADVRTGIRKGVYYVLMMCLGLGLYFIILNNRLQNLGAELTTYQGMDSTGQIRLGELPGLLMKCYVTFLQFPTVLYHSINTLPIIRKGIAVLLVLSLILGIWAICRQKKWLNRIMTAILLLLVPVAVNLIEIMCSRSNIYELMIYSTVFIFLLPIILWKRIQVENGAGRLLLKIFGIGMAAVFVITALGYGWHANWNYVAVDYMNRETASYMTTLVTRIKSADGYRDEYPVLFVGERHFDDQHFKHPYSDYAELYFELYQEQSLINGFSWREAMLVYTGFIFTVPSEQKSNEIYASNEFQQMSCYPDDGSIAVIDEVIVIKITD